MFLGSFTFLLVIANHCSTSVEYFTKFGAEMYNRYDRCLKLECSIFLWLCPIYSCNNAIREGSHRLLISCYILTIWKTEISQITHVLVIYQPDNDQMIKCRYGL
jgi:hypothetical protein